MTFDEAYYASDLPRFDHPHFQRRADWILANHGGKRVIELGCGFGQVIQKLRDQGVVAWGVDKSAYAIANTYASGFVFEIAVEDYTDAKNQDFLVSWNFFDCLTSEAEAALILDAIDKATTQYHVICMDNADAQSQAYKDAGYFIKESSYWLSLFPSDVVLIDYHTRAVFNNAGAALNIPPLSWNFTSE